MNFAFILLQAAGEGGGEGAPPGGLFGGGNYTWIFMIGIMVVFWLFFMRPQQKKQKEERKFRENLSKGDKVVTAGGIFGKIHSVDDTTVLMEVDNGTKIRVSTEFIRPAPEPKAEGQKTA